MSFLSPMTQQRPNGTTLATPTSSATTNPASQNNTNDTNGSTQDAHQKKKHVLIVGGSLAGLFAGVALKSHGYATTILERNPSKILDNQGAGIIAGGDTLAFFRKYDRFGREVAVPSKGRLYLDREGKVVHEEPMDQHMTSWDLCYYVLRANYDGLESGYVDGVGEKKKGGSDGDIDFRYGCTVTEFDVTKEGRVRVKYETDDGKSEEVEGDMLVGADGPSSTVRKLVSPDVERSYAGYVVIRGTVPEDEASEEAKKVFVERFTFHHAPGNQNLTYTIPGKDGTLEPGKRLMNFVWYTNFPEGSEEQNELMTDVDGKKHRITIPQGKMRPDVWEKMKERARKQLPPQMAEMVEKTEKPFVQAITDAISPTNIYHDGKVVLVGDALANFRPHTVASTSQAAYDVMVLVDWLDGKYSNEEFQTETMKFARLVQDRGVKMGNRSQFEDLPLMEYVKDRNRASTKRQDEAYEDWMLK